MNITFAFPLPSLSGGCRVVAIYAQSLSDSGHNVTIVCPKYKYGGLLNGVKRLLSAGPSAKQRLAKSHFAHLRNVEVVQLSPKNLTNPACYPNADIIVATWWKTVEWIQNFPEQHGQKCYFIQHYETHDEQPQLRVENTYRTSFPKIVIAEWLYQIMSSRYNHENVQLVPNAVDHSQFFRSHDSVAQKNTLCTMYSESNFKGVDITLAAFSRIRELKPSVRLIMFGAEALPNHHALPDGIEYVVSPSKDALREIYSNSRAYIFSSRTEGFGLPVLEALACGCPVVATMAGCAPEYIVDGVNGYITEIDNVDGQVRGMERILTLNDAAWSEMSIAATNSVAKSSWINSALTFEKALLSIAGVEQMRTVEDVL